MQEELLLSLALLALNILQGAFSSDADQRRQSNMDWIFRSKWTICVFPSSCPSFLLRDYLFQYYMVPRDRKDAAFGKQTRIQRGSSRRSSTEILCHKRTPRSRPASPRRHGMHPSHRGSEEDPKPRLSVEPPSTALSSTKSNIKDKTQYL